MAYYDRWATDPHSSNELLAKRLGISLEELRERIDRIGASAQTGVHLTLGEALGFISDPEQFSDGLRSHLDACPYCQAMVDGLLPDHVNANARLLMKELQEAPTRLRYRSAFAQLQRFTLPVAAISAIVCAAFVVGLFIVDNEPGSRRAVNARLACSVSACGIDENDRLAMATQDTGDLVTRLLEARQVIHSDQEIPAEAREKLLRILSDRGEGRDSYVAFANPVSVAFNDDARSRASEALEQTFNRNKGALYAVYNRALRDNPTLKGDVEFVVTVAPDGRVMDCEVKSTDIADPAFVRQLVSRIELFRFEPVPGQEVTFSKRISFHAH